MARSKNTVSHETDAGPALLVAEFPIAATGKDADERAKHVHTAELAFPRRQKAGVPKTEAEAAQLEALHLRTFIGNYRSYVVRGGKSYAPEEILEAWNAYELGAPRERTGETLRHKAGYMFVQEWLAAKNAERAAMTPPKDPLPWPRAQKGKMTDEQAASAREAMIQKALNSEVPETQQRITELEAQLRAEQAEARKSASTVASVDELADATDF